VRRLHDPNLKLGFATHVVPEPSLAGWVPLARPPRVGDLAVAEVARIGRHATIELRSGVTANLFPGDRLVAVFGHRYATDQYEGYVPPEPVAECDLLSAGGVCGTVASQHASMAAPTRLRLLGVACDGDGAPLNTRAFALPPRDGGGDGGEVILVVGSAMNAGKTTTAGAIARALTRAGARVAAAKVTGTAAGKDLRYLRSCGARPVLDFTDLGYPSTYLADPGELVQTFRVLLSHLRAAAPDFVVLEVADGLVQRETRLLLDAAEFRREIAHVFFAAGDSLAAAYGVQFLRERGLAPWAVSGAVTQSALAMREVEETTGLPCLSVERLMAGDLPARLGQPRPAWDRAAVPADTLVAAGLAS
jgi:hypothetical protein